VSRAGQRDSLEQALSLLAAESGALDKTIADLKSEVTETDALSFVDDSLGQWVEDPAVSLKSLCACMSTGAGDGKSSVPMLSVNAQ
jgi:hypothetical protein